MQTFQFPHPSRLKTTNTHSFFCTKWKTMIIGIRIASKWAVSATFYLLLLQPAWLAAGSKRESVAQLSPRTIQYMLCVIWTRFRIRPTQNTYTSTKNNCLTGIEFHCAHVCLRLPHTRAMHRHVPVRCAANGAAATKSTGVWVPGNQIQFTFWISWQSIRAFISSKMMKS